jgi:hypothetical protein
MELKYSQLFQISNFTNDKMVNIIREKISESENASLALVFDDKLIVLNEEANEFYQCEYNVQNKALNLKNWEKVELLPDNNTKLESLSFEFFNPLNENEIKVKDLVNAFKLKYSDEPFKSLINESMSKKKGITQSNAKIKAITELRKVREFLQDDIKEIMEDLKIKALKEEITKKSPIQTVVNRIDFKNPISISLFEEASEKVVNLTEKKKSKKRSMNISKKVKNLWTSESFKKEFADLIKEAVKSENSKEIIEKFLEQHKELLVLSESDFEDLILKTVLISSDAKNANSIVENFVEAYNDPKFQDFKEEYLERNKIEEGKKEGDDDDEEESDEEESDEDDKKEDDGEEDKDKDKKKKDDKKEDETSIDEDTINKFIKVFDKIKEQLKEKTLEHKYVSKLIETLEDAKIGSISEGKLKEVVDFLDSVYVKSQQEKDNEAE